ncbi:MAG: 3'-5' exoribonuclease [Bacteroidales bacterium]|nr:3'-5' exoribonuclease [Bacteroides sp.]MCM1503524.1 3'-5' exoribonuclease [Bacteroidales bacterium]
MKDFIAIDFETANECPSSVCSIGAVLVRDGKIVKSFYSLIRPEPEYYKWFCQRVHGITEEETRDAQCFPSVWTEMERTLAGEEGMESLDLPFVAHNSRFDENCLKSVFRVYRMNYPGYIFHDTLCASRRHFGCSLPNHQLQTVAEACGYALTNHHHALADAEACAAIACKIL